jgi:predicted alpha/beta hydrolase family esterase
LGDEHFDKLNHTFTHQVFDFEKIKQNAGKIFIIAGDNDPYVPISETETLADKLNTESILIKNGKHLNAEAGYTKFPELLTMINSCLKVQPLSKEQMKY